MVDLSRFEFTPQQKSLLVEESIDWLKDSWKENSVALPTSLIRAVKRALLDNLRELIITDELTKEFSVNLNDEELKDVKEFLTLHFREKLSDTINDHGTDVGRDVKELLSA